MPPEASAREPSESTILGLDNVPLELPVAGAGSRTLSAFLDYLVLAVVMIVSALAVTFLAVLTDLARLGSGFLLALVLIGLFLLDYGYFAGVEIASGGRSFGKWALGLQVVTRWGGRPGIAALLLRNCVRSVDLLVGVPLMAIDPLARRLGDRLAGTLVIQTRAREPEVVVHRFPAGWGGKEVAVLESFLRRAPELEPARAESMARHLLACIERDDRSLLDGIPPGLDTVETLKRAVRAEGV